MSSRIKQAALRILLIQEEYTEKELREAIKLIQNDTPKSFLFKYLTNSNQGISTNKNQEKGTKPFDQQRSKAVLQIKDKEPDKYKVLSHLDILLRKGLVLQSLNDIKAFVLKISKDFPKVKSRKDSIPKLITLLADKPLTDITTLLEDILKQTDSSTDDSDYQRLAQYLINGRKCT